MRHRSSVPLAIVTGAFLLTVLLVAPPLAFGQYQGHNLKGDFASNSGTQPAPGVYVLVPYYQWNMDRIKDADGDRVAAGFQGADLRAIPPAFIAITKKKLLGANYGFVVTAPFSKIRPEQTEILGDGSWGFTDMYVVPLYLGWHTPRADVVAGYGFFAPTGKYEVGGTDNIGLGMWSHEVQAGVTAFFDDGKRVSAATTMYLEMHSKKKDQDLKVGNLLTLEGGVAYNVPKIGGVFGVGYFLQNKVSDDSGADVPVAFLRALNLYGRNRSFGIGPDVSMGVFQRGSSVGLLTARYFWETAAKSGFEGGTLFVGLTVASLAR